MPDIDNNPIVIDPSTYKEYDPYNFLHEAVTGYIEIVHGHAFHNNDQFRRGAGIIHSLSLLGISSESYKNVPLDMAILTLPKSMQERYKSGVIWDDLVNKLRMELNRYHAITMSIWDEDRFDSEIKWPELEPQS